MIRLTLNGLAAMALVLLLLSGPAGSRPAETKNDLIRVNLTTVLSTDNGPVIILKEEQGDRFLPIRIGEMEAIAIALGLHKHLGGSPLPQPERPLTHHLLLNILNQFGAKIDKVVVRELKNDTFYADIFLTAQGGKQMIIDSRPSDAVALAMNMDKPAPIFVARHVMDRASERGEKQRGPIKL